MDAKVTRYDAIKARDATPDPLVAKAEHDAKNRNGTRERSAQRRQMLALYYRTSRDRRWLLGAVETLSAALRGYEAAHTDDVNTDRFDTEPTTCGCRLCIQADEALALLTAAASPEGKE
jgi:hypothetical protein